MNAQPDLDIPPFLRRQQNQPKESAMTHPHPEQQAAITAEEDRREEAIAKLQKIGATIAGEDTAALPLPTEEELVAMIKKLAAKREEIMAEANTKAAEVSEKIVGLKKQLQKMLGKL